MIKKDYVKQLEERIKFLDKICIRFSFKIVKQNEQIAKLRKKLQE
jgi:uncharacterized coiled-coil protein SlyX